MFNKNIIFLILLFSSGFIISQSDTVKYQWADAPFNSSKTINGTFGEFRNTLSSDHFHNGVDIGEPDGNPVYTSLDGSVNQIVNSGSNSYVEIRSEIDGKWKKIIYLHIVPNPSLVLGQTVMTGQTVMGTIYNGMGHIHIIEKELVSNPAFTAVQINPIRPQGGLTPYFDSKPPVIHSNTIKFYADNSALELSSQALFGKVDIKVKVEEQNGSSSSGNNNGTYILGYRIWNADTSNIIYEPFSNGIAYRFDRLPNNSDVHKVFVKNEATLSIPLYWLTNGNGADLINATRSIPNNYFDTELFTEGDYVLEIFSEDTRQNKSKYFKAIKIATPPSTPVLKAVINTNKKHAIKVLWEKNTENDIAGYRLYYSINTQFSTWRLAADESMLTTELSSYEFESPGEFTEPPSNDIYFFYMTAVDSLGAESNPSDIYSRAPHNNGTQYPTALIVDGFDRFGGSGAWNLSTHQFNTSYFIPLFISDSIVISSAADEAVGEGYIDLNEYDMVFWFVGDGGGPDKSFNQSEKDAIENYLSNGGSLLVSGSQIGLDLATPHSNSEDTDSAFYKDYLKAEFLYTGDSQMDLVSGKEGNLFERLEINIGQEYAQRWPDDINPVLGSESLMYYNSERNDGDPRIAAIGYKGTFAAGIDEAKLIYLGFALETAYSLIERKEFLSKVLEYFGTLTSLETDFSLPQNFSVSNNYPNPFNPSTKFTIGLPSRSKIKIEIFNLLGQRIRVLANEILDSGIHEFTWNASSVDNFKPSGIYFARVTSSGEDLNKNSTVYKTIKMLLLK